jgi:hypothetical protein
MGVGRGEQEEWEFVLMFAGPAESRETIVWSDLVPGENVTRWLTINRAVRRLVIKPAMAVLAE